MKSDNDVSTLMILFSKHDDTNKKDKITPNLEQSNLSKDKKINNNTVNNNYENNNLSLQISEFNNNGTDINQGEQSELNNFNISFFLPKDLQENIEAEEKAFTENRLNQEEECNPIQINNIKSNNQIDNNNDFNSNNNEFMNIGNSKKITPNLNNNDYINQLNDYQLQEMNNNFHNMNINNINEFNNNYNPISNGYNNLSIPNKYLFFNNEQNHPQNMPLNNQNISPSSGQNINNILGNQLPKCQLLLNNCNFLSSISQINLNFNHFKPQQNNLAYYYSQNKFNNNNNIAENESKKRKKKIIDDYTIEMFGRRGWICELCNNFNYDTRKKCNRCHINKKPKKIKNYLLSERNKNINHKNDWHCPNCGNFNYSFRVICNRCQKKKVE